MNADRSVHIDTRPTWMCAACAEPWPCANAKRELRREFRDFPSVLSVYMSAKMLDAAGDFTDYGTGPPPDLYERFMSWIRSRVAA